MGTRKKNNVIQLIPSTQVYYDRAMRAFEKQDIHKAIDYFKKGVSLAKNKQEEMFGSVQIALMMQHLYNFQDSIALLNDLLEKTENSCPELFYFQATNYIHIEEFETALSLVEVYLNMSPKGPYRKEANQMKHILEERLSKI